MSKKKSVSVKKVSKKKEIIDTIKPLITSALVGIEKKVGEKNFEKSVKKASKLLASTLKISTSDKKTEAKKEIKANSSKALKNETISNPAKKTASAKSSKKLQEPKKKNPSKKIKSIKIEETIAV